MPTKMRLGGEQFEAADKAKAKAKAFAPQGETGGPFHMEGRTGEGKPAQLRSENAERAQAKNAAGKVGASRPASILGHMVNPAQAQLQDIDNAKMHKTVEQTGGDD